VSEIVACLGCGRTKPSTGTVDDLLQADQCSDCPPWQCERCERIVDMDAKLNCGTCVMRFAGMPLADIKAALADIDLGVTITGGPGVSGQEEN
jgi:hypothetical protein